MKDVPIVEWAGAYDDNWQEILVPAAFAHPAKMARGLARMIYDELFRTGALAKGNTVVDPFGGIGSTALEGTPRGVQVVCCELEPRFCELANQNFLKHYRDWQDMGYLLPIMVQGDSRKLRQALKPVLSDAVVDCVIDSPPYEGALSARGGRQMAQAGIGNATAGADDPMRDSGCYSDNPANLGNLDGGSVAAVVTSPPYEGNTKSDYLVSDDGKTRARDERRGYTQGRGCFRGSEAAYGQEDGQLGAMNSDGVDAVLASPPYVAAPGHDTGHPRLDATEDVRRETEGCARRNGYGAADGQMSDLRAGSVDAVISSPPYAEIAAGAGGLNTTPAKHDGQQSGRTPTSASQDTDQRYGESAGQLARLDKGSVDAVVCSPPYAAGDSASAQSITERTDKSATWIKERFKAVGNAAMTQGYGTTAGQMAEMKMEGVDAVVSSNLTTDTKFMAAVERDKRNGSRLQPGLGEYGSTDGQIGAESGETFWSAAQLIVRECYAILKPGGVAVWVVKSFVRDKAIVDFPGDWRKLCEHEGFETYLEVHASLVAEEIKTDLFDGDRIVKRERKSFFRRLAEKKGSPKIDFEVVLFMRKVAR